MTSPPELPDDPPARRGPLWRVAAAVYVVLWLVAAALYAAPVGVWLSVAWGGWAAPGRLIATALSAVVLPALALAGWAAVRTLRSRRTHWYLMGGGAAAALLAFASVQYARWLVGRKTAAAGPDFDTAELSREYDLLLTSAGLLFGALAAVAAGVVGRWLLHPGPVGRDG